MCVCVREREEDRRSGWSRAGVIFCCIVNICKQLLPTQPKDTHTQLKAARKNVSKGRWEKVDERKIKGGGVIARLKRTDRRITAKERE